ncbi:YdeI/OmpD-associated family protein [bacterium]|nr:YdeI/OmpD-associated family protein [bacterium]
MAKLGDIEAYIAAHPAWAASLTTLREVLCREGLEETIKWGSPVYCLAGRNVVGLGAFKSYVGLWFFQGALLDDPDGVLVNAQEGKTRAQRQWRFGPADRIPRTKVRAYVREAMENQRRGREIRPERGRPVDVPAELAAALAADPSAAGAFAALSAGCRREYAEHVAEAKREETRRRRVAKILPLIREGAGLNDRYRR